MADDNKHSPLVWAPAIAGGAVSTSRTIRGIANSDPRSWFFDPSTAGRGVKDQIASSRLVSAPIDPLAQIDKMSLEQSWRRLPEPFAKRAVAEATRASLLRGARMPIAEIDMLSRNILAPKGYNDFFEQARIGVSQHGDPRVFTETLRRYFPDNILASGDQVAPGVFFGQEKLDEMFGLARRTGKTANWIRPPAGSSPKPNWWVGAKITGTEKATLNRYMKKLGSGATVKHLIKYPEDITMAHLNLGVKGLAAPIDLTLPLHATRHRKPQAEYIMNKVFSGIPSQGGKMMSWGDFYVKEVKDSLLPSILKSAKGKAAEEIKGIIRQKTKAFETRMTEYMMWTPSARHPGLNFMNDVNSKMIVAPDLSEMIARNAGDKLRPDIDREMGLLFEEQGLYPGKSGGQIKAGRMIGGADPRSLWAYGDDFPFERRPLQFGREFTPTTGALAAMRSTPAAFGFSRRMPFLATAARKEIIRKGVIAPQLLMGYAVKGGRAADVLGEKGIGLAAEESVIRKHLLPMFETERITQMKLGLHEPVGEGKKIAKWLEDAVQGKGGSFSLERGQQIGYELKTGKALRAADIPGMTQKLVKAQLAMAGIGEEAAQVFLKETHSTEDWIKLFGSGKITFRGRDKAYMRKVEKGLGIQMAKDLDAFAWADDLRKNRSLLKQQMTSGLGMLAQQRLEILDSLVAQHTRAISLGNMKVAKRLERKMDIYDKVMSKTAWMEMQGFGSMRTGDITAMLPDELAILKKGRSWGLDIRLIGGAMEEAADILPEGMLGQAKAVAGKGGLIHPSGLVVGAAFSNVGDYRHTMGGGIIEKGIQGSMEPRGILSLLQHKWMVGGENVAHMLAAEHLRLMGGYGSDVNEVMKIARSMTGEKLKGLDKVTAWETGGREAAIPLRKAGYMLDLGVPVKEFGGASSIYVPGEEAMQRFGQFRGKGGEILRTDLVKKYDALARAATRVKNLGNEVTATTSLGIAAKELTGAVMQEAGQAGYGRGGGARVFGALRGKRAGSQFLAVSSVDQVMSTARQGVVELSERAAEDMYAELQKKAATVEEASYIRSQRKAYLQGKVVPGDIARHPFIGPYSRQPTGIIRAPGPASAKEYFVNVPAYMNEMVDVAGKSRATLGKQLKVNMSPLVGLGLDYDADRPIVSLIGNEKTARATERLLRDGNYMREYKRFAAESAVLGTLAKKQLGTGAAPALRDLDKLVLGSTKLRIAAAETGGISNALSEAKLAMSYYNPKAASQFNLIAEVMEQQIISGKKMKEIGSQNIARRVTSAIEEISSPNAAPSELNALVEETNRMFGSQLKTGVELRSRELGRWTMKVDSQQLWEQAQGALQQGRGREGIITQYRQMARGTGTLSIGSVLSQMEAARQDKSNSLAALAFNEPSAAPRGKMASAVSRAISRMNRINIQELGATAKTWARPAFWGLAGTAAAVMLSGSIKGQPMDSPMPGARGDVRGLAAYDAQRSGAMLRGITPSERDMRPESLPIPDSVSGAPTSAGMASPSTYMTNSAPLSHRVIARANAGPFSPDHESVVNALRPVVGSASMRVNFRDNRARLTSQNIADMLEEA